MSNPFFASLKQKDEAQTTTAATTTAATTTTTFFNPFLQAVRQEAPQNTTAAIFQPISSNSSIANPFFKTPDNLSVKNDSPFNDIVSNPKGSNFNPFLQASKSAVGSKTNSGIFGQSNQEGSQEKIEGK